MQKDASLSKESLISAQLSFHHRIIPNNEIAASAQSATSCSLCWMCLVKQVHDQEVVMPRYPRWFCDVIESSSALSDVEHHAQVRISMVSIQES